VSSASDSQGCRTQDEHAARVFQEIEDGNFGAMNDIAEEVAAVNAVAAAKAGEKRAAAQSAAAKAANMAVAAARRSEKATKAAAKRFEKDAKKQCRSATLTPVEEEGGGGGVKCPTSTVFGVAHAQKSGSMLAWDEKKRRLKAQHGKRFCELDLEAEKVAWQVKSYFEIPADERWRLLRDIQYRFKEICRDKPRAELQAHNNAKRQRAIEAGEMDQRKEQRCALSYAKFKDHAMVTTEQGLTQLRSKHAAPPRTATSKPSETSCVRGSTSTNKPSSKSSFLRSGGPTP
jgi:hypothetical protein